jgi:hypothetical protein
MYNQVTIKTTIRDFLTKEQVQELYASTRK